MMKLFGRIVLATALWIGVTHGGYAATAGSGGSAANEQSAIQASTLGNNAVEAVIQHQVPSETTLSAEGMWGQPIFSDLLLFPPEGRSILIKSYNLLRLWSIVV